MDQLTLGGSQIYIDWELTPLNENSTLGWIIIFFDPADSYNELKAIMEATRLEFSLDLVENLAHELRNPLQAANGLVQLLSGTSSPDKISAFCELILNELERINYLFNKFSAVSEPSKNTSTNNKCGTSNLGA